MINRTLFHVAALCLMGVVADTGAAQPSWTALEDKLRIALQGADTAAVRELVKAGASVNARDVLGGNALHLAANFSGHLEVLKLLLSRGAKVTGAGAGAQLPLRAAMDPVNLPQIELLLKHGTAVSDDGQDWAIIESSPLFSTPTQQAWGKKLLPLLMRHGADAGMKVGKELDKNYEQLAKEMRVSDLLERAKVQHAPR